MRHARTGTGSRLAALVACSLAAFACGGGRRVDLPAVEVGQSAHFRYFARAADRVPATVLDLLEWHWSTMSSFFGLDPGLVTYYLFDSEDDLKKNGPCPDAACESVGSVYTAEFIDEHELIHAYFFNQATAPPIIGEGVASAMSCFEYHWAPTQPPNDPSWQAAVSHTHEDTTDYGQSRLVRYLIRQHGPQAIAAFYRTLRYTLDPATFAAQFQSYWGESIDDVWPLATAPSTMPTYLDAAMCPCPAEPAPLDGTAVSVAAPFGTYAPPITLSLDSSSDLDLRLTGLGLATVRNCWDHDYEMDLLQPDLPDNPPSQTLLTLGPGRFYVQALPNDPAHASLSAASGTWHAAACGAGQPLPIDAGFSGTVNLWSRAFDSFVQLDVAGPRAATVTTGPAARGVTLCPACDAPTTSCTGLQPLSSASLSLNGTYQVTLPAGAQLSISFPPGP